MRTKTSLGQVNISFPCRPDYLRLVRKVVDDAGLAMNLSYSEAGDLKVAVLEAVANAVNHSKATTVQISITRENDHVVITVVDNGKGFRFLESLLKFPSALARGGRGIPLMNAFVDTVSFDSIPGKGTRVTMIKRFRKA